MPDDLLTRKSNVFGFNFEFINTYLWKTHHLRLRASVIGDERIESSLRRGRWLQMKPADHPKLDL